MLINMFSPTFAPNLVTLAKIDRLIKWSVIMIMRKFNETEHP